MKFFFLSVHFLKTKVKVLSFVDESDISYEIMLLEYKKVGTDRISGLYQ